jgi:hypothetical protein
MTGLLEEALRRVESLSQKEQDSIASQILDSLDGEKEWELRFRSLPAALLQMGKDAPQEHQRNETVPLDKLIP